MTTSEYVVKHLADRGVNHVFGIIGSVMYGIFTALGETEGIEYICPLHEQAASMGADGYSRATGKIGVAIGTTGPGITNLVTGCAGAYADSIPVLYIVGQPAKTATKQNLPIRYYAFQEIDTEKVFSSITKYIGYVDQPEYIKYEIDKAMDIAMSGRKGPVVIMLPEDIMYLDIDTILLKEYETERNLTELNYKAQEHMIDACLERIVKSKKMLLLFGAGVHASAAEEEARKLVKALGCPVVMTYPARDIIAGEDSLNAGSIGIFGSQSGNRALQEADLLIGIGVRLDRFITGTPQNFASNAYKIMVDIDKGECEKYREFGLSVDKVITSDAKVFLHTICSKIEKNRNRLPSFTFWNKQIADWKIQYPVYRDEYESEPELNPYYFMKHLSKHMKGDEFIVSDTGLSAAWIGQAFDFKVGQRWFMQFGFSAMGYALSAAIGVSFATDNLVVGITGDGGLQMSIQELSTLSYWNRNVKLFVICNDAYGLIQKTQDDYNKGHYGTDREYHVPFMDIGKIAEACHIPVLKIEKNEEIDRVLDNALNSAGPLVCCVHVPVSKKISPRVVQGDLMNMKK